MQTAEVGVCGELDAAELDPAVEPGLPKVRLGLEGRVDDEHPATGPDVRATPFSADRDRSDERMNERRAPEVPALGKCRAALGLEPVERTALHLDLVQEPRAIQRGTHQDDAIEADRLGELALEHQPLDPDVAQRLAPAQPFQGLGRGERRQGRCEGPRVVVGQLRRILRGRRWLELGLRPAMQLGHRSGLHHAIDFQRQLIALHVVRHDPPRSYSQNPQDQLKGCTRGHPGGCRVGRASIHRGEAHHIHSVGLTPRCGIRPILRPSQNPDDPLRTIDVEGRQWVQVRRRIG